MSGADAGLLVAHCQARMLHPAALMDFECYVQGLLAWGTGPGRSAVEGCCGGGAPPPNRDL